MDNRNNGCSMWSTPYSSLHMYASSAETAINKAAVSLAEKRWLPSFINSEPWQPTTQLRSSSKQRTTEWERILLGLTSKDFRKDSPSAQQSPCGKHGAATTSDDGNAGEAAPVVEATDSSGEVQPCKAGVRSPSSQRPRGAGARQPRWRGRGRVLQPISDSGANGKKAGPPARHLWDPFPPGPRPPATPFTDSPSTPLAKMQRPATANVPGVTPESPSISRPRTADTPSSAAPINSPKARLGIAPAEKPKVTQDAALNAVAQRLTKALSAHYLQTGRPKIASGGITVVEDWLRFLAEHDSAGTKRLSLDDFDDLLRTKLGTSVSRYEVRVLHRRLDTDDTGQVWHREIASLMYRVELATWPNISTNKLEWIVQKLTETAEKWHKTGGNWFAIFKQSDPDWVCNKGLISFQAVRQCVRGRFPGLSLKPQQLSDSSLQGLWKAVDNAGELEVPVQRFMTFLRRHGAKVPSRIGTPSMSCTRETLQEQLALTANILDIDGLRQVAARLAAGLRPWLSKFGRRAANVESSPSAWSELFDAVRGDEERLFRITFGEWTRTIRTTLQITNVSDEELQTLWTSIDEDQSGEVTWKEFGKGFYRLQVHGWPTSNDQELKATTNVLNRAANQWHRAAGNWFKIFSLIDLDEEGEMEFEELLDVVRKSFPGLSLKKEDISDHDLRGFWKAMDQDQSGIVTVMEFMIFMRNHSGMSMSKTPQKRKKQNDAVYQLGPSPERTNEELVAIATHVDKAISLYVGGTAGSRCSPFGGTKWDALVYLNQHNMEQSDFFKTPASPSKKQQLTITLSWLLHVLRECYVKHSHSQAKYGGSTNGLLPGYRHEEDLQWEDDTPVSRGVTCGDVRALWAMVFEAVAAEGSQPSGIDVAMSPSSKITVKQWHSKLYGLQVQSWPDAKPATLERVINKINVAAEKWHRAGNNWYKVLRIFDKEDIGRFSFDEFYELLRRPCPCLALSSAAISDVSLKAFWKAMDAERCGEITLSEFIVFMRRRGAVCGSSSKGPSRSEGTAWQEQAERPTTSDRPSTAPKSESSAATAVNQAAVDLCSQGDVSWKQAAHLRDALSNESEDSLAAAYEDWGIPWTGVVSEWTWLTIVRQLLGLRPEQFDDDSAHQVWAMLDRSKAGEVDVGVVLELGWEREAVPESPGAVTSTPSERGRNQTL